MTASRSSSRRARAFLAACAAVGGAAASPASAAPLSACTTHHGTVIAVDFGHWGGPIVRGCGIDQPTGYALLHAAGFTTAGDAQDGNVFVCRLGDAAFHHGTQYPTPSEDPCIVTPPASAYWSYWLAPAGQNSWTYSSLGPLGDVPKPGEVELWKFGGTKIGGTSGSGVPRFGPGKLRAAVASTAHAHKTANTTTTTTTTQSTTPTTTTTAPQHAAAKPRRAPQRRRSSHADRTSTAPATPPPATTTTGPPVVAAEPTRASTSAGSPVPLVIGICAAFALAAAGAWAAWRRRRIE